MKRQGRANGERGGEGEGGELAALGFEVEVCCEGRVGGGGGREKKGRPRVRTARVSCFSLVGEEAGGTTRGWRGEGGCVHPQTWLRTATQAIARATAEMRAAAAGMEARCLLMGETRSGRLPSAIHPIWTEDHHDDASINTIIP